jgi:hypothetical protein
MQAIDLSERLAYIQKVLHSMYTTRGPLRSTRAESGSSPLVTTTSRSSSSQKNTTKVEIVAIADTESNLVPPPVSSEIGTSGYARHLLRSWGMGWVLVALASVRKSRSRPEKEQRKVAIYHGIWYFCGQGLFHLIPIAIGIGLASMNVIGHYVGSDLGGPPLHDSVKLVGFQVAAKMIELLCVASIARFILAFVRHELVSPRGIPFGILSSSLDFSRVTYLMSHEFWSAVRAPTKQIYRRVFFVLALALSTILATLIGPTTAILLQPRLEWWPAGGTDVWIDTTQDALYPSVINSSSIVRGSGYDCETSDHENCPSAGWQGLAKWLNTFQFNDHGAGSSIPNSGLTFTVREAQSEPLFGMRPQDGDLLTAQTWMFVPNIALSRAFGGSIFLWYGAAQESQRRGETNFASYKDAYYSMIGRAPGLATRCNTTMRNPDGNTCVSFPSSVSASPQDSVHICDNVQMNKWMSNDFASNSTRQPSIHWIDGSFDGPNDIGMEMPNGFSGAALITVPGQRNASDAVVGCTMHTHYTTLTYWKGLAINYPTALKFGVDTHTDVEYPGGPADSVSTVQVSWLKSLNPPLPKLNSSVFDQLVEAVGARGDESSAYAPYANRFEALLLFMVGNGLARMQSLTYPIGEVKDRSSEVMGPYWRNLLPQRGLGVGGDAYNVTAEVRQRAVTNRLYVAVNGYAYAYFDSSGTLWSIIIVLTYVLFALVLFGVLLRRGCYSSTSWGSATEISALALESEPLGGDFVNTTAGIDTLGPLKRSVRVTVRDGRMQIVEASDKRLYDAEVKSNVEY